MSGNDMEIRISVLIPAYNSERTIRATLDSVLAQTITPHEIIAVDDGSTDATPGILKEYGPRVATFRQENGGVSTARNRLVAMARGDLIAFIDSDDLWHPRYLETQVGLFRRFPQAAALFVDHLNFSGFGDCDWGADGREVVADGERTVELLEPLTFFRRFRAEPGPFVLSFGCIPKRVFDGMGPEPFKFREAEDVYFCNLLTFNGPVVFASAPPLAAYRIREGSLASNRLKCTEAEVQVYELLEARYEQAGDAILLAEFRKTFASKRRGLAKIQLGTGNTTAARRQLRASFIDTRDLASWAKSLALLSASYLPRTLQPAWPSLERQWKPAATAVKHGADHGSSQTEILNGIR